MSTGVAAAAGVVARRANKGEGIAKLPTHHLPATATKAADRVNAWAASLTAAVPWLWADLQELRAQSRTEPWNGSV